MQSVVAGGMAQCVLGWASSGGRVVLGSVRGITCTEGLLSTSVLPRTWARGPGSLCGPPRSTLLVAQVSCSGRGRGAPGSLRGPPRSTLLVEWIIFLVSSRSTWPLMGGFL